MSASLGTGPQADCQLFVTVATWWRACHSLAGNSWTVQLWNQAGSSSQDSPCSPWLSPCSTPYTPALALWPPAPWAEQGSDAKSPDCPGLAADVRPSQPGVSFQRSEEALAALDCLRTTLDVSKRLAGYVWVWGFHSVRDTQNCNGPPVGVGEALKAEKLGIHKSRAGPDFGLGGNDGNVEDLMGSGHRSQGVLRRDLGPRTGLKEGFQARKDP